MVAPKEIPAGAAVGQLPDGSINIGTPEEMRKKFEQAQAESDNADFEVAALYGESQDDDEG